MIGKSPTQTVRLDKKHRDAEIKSVINIKSPHLWSTEDPYLYTLMTFVSDVKTGQLLDTYQTTTGLRYFSFDPKTGFALNGKPMKINGVCMHHDLGRSERQSIHVA